MQCCCSSDSNTRVEKTVTPRASDEDVDHVERVIYTVNESALAGAPMAGLSPEEVGQATRAHADAPFGSPPDSAPASARTTSPRSAWTTSEPLRRSANEREEDVAEEPLLLVATERKEDVVRRAVTQEPTEVSGELACPVESGGAARRSGRARTLSEAESRLELSMELPPRPEPPTWSHVHQMPGVLRIAAFPIVVFLLSMVLALEIPKVQLRTVLVAFRIFIRNRGVARLPGIQVLFVWCLLFVVTFMPWGAVVCGSYCGNALRYVPWVWSSISVLASMAIALDPSVGLPSLGSLGMSWTMEVLVRAPLPVGCSSQLLGQVRAGWRVGECTLLAESNDDKLWKIGFEMACQLCGDIGGRYELLVRAISDGMPVDTLIDGGHPLLSNQAWAAEPKTVRFLLAEGADPNTTNTFGEAALHAACALRPWHVWKVPGLLVPWQVQKQIRTGRDASYIADTFAALLESDATDPCQFNLVGHTPYAWSRRAGDIEALRPPVPWARVEAALREASGTNRAKALLGVVPPGRPIRALRLTDLLFCRHEGTGGELERRRHFLWEELLLPMMREVTRRPLAKDEKEVLVYCWEASRGPPQNRAVARHTYRAQRDSTVQETMGKFAAELQPFREALLASPEGATLWAKPAVELMVGPGELRHDRFLEAAALSWALSRDFKAAVLEFRRAGIVTTALGLVRLVNDGIHPLVGKKPRADIFGAQGTPELFWRGMVALWLISRHEKAKATFDEIIHRSVSEGRLHSAPLKGFSRIMEKAGEYIVENGLRTWADKVLAPMYVIDILRVTIETDTAAQQLRVEDELLAAMPLVRAKNGHHPDAVAVGGYRDVKLNLLLRHDDDSGLRTEVLTEVQLVLSAFADVKAKMHAIYRIHRGDFDN